MFNFKEIFRNMLHCAWREVLEKSSINSPWLFKRWKVTTLRLPVVNDIRSLKIKETGLEMCSHWRIRTTWLRSNLVSYHVSASYDYATHQVQKQIELKNKRYLCPDEFWSHLTVFAIKNGDSVEELANNHFFRYCIRRRNKMRESHSNQSS